MLVGGVFYEVRTLFPLFRSLLAVISINKGLMAHLSTFLHRDHVADS
jgi:hypothetical protein